MIAPAPTLTRRATLEALREGGYTLSLNTRTVAYEYKTNVSYTSFAGALMVRGDAPPPEELREAMHEHAVYLKAAVAVADSPTDWIAEVVRRYVVGTQTETKRAGKKVILEVNLDSLVANITAFLDEDREQMLGVVRAALWDELNRPELVRAVRKRRAKTIIVQEDDEPPKYKKEPYRIRQRRLKDEEKAGHEYEQLVEERLRRWDKNRKR